MPPPRAFHIRLSCSLSPDFFLFAFISKTFSPQSPPFDWFFIDAISFADSHAAAIADFRQLHFRRRFAALNFASE